MWFDMTGGRKYSQCVGQDSTNGNRGLDLSQKSHV